MPRIFIISKRTSVLALVAAVVGNVYALPAAADPPPVVTKTTGTVALHEQISIEVTGLSNWQSSNPEKSDPSKFVLYLNGAAMPGIEPRISAPSPLPPAHVDNSALEASRANQPGAEEKKTQASSDKPADGAKPDHQTLCFDLELIGDNKDNVKAWNTLLRRPTWRDLDGPVSLAQVALAYDKQIFPSVENLPPLKIRKLSKWGCIFALLFVLGLCWLLFYLATQTNLLRDPGPAPSPEKEQISGAPSPGNTKTFSLGRSQMAFWFIVIVACYLSIWMITGAVDTLTGSVLELIGISSATGFASMLVDGSKRKTAAEQLAAADQLAALKTQKNSLLAASANPPGPNEKLTVIDNEIASLEYQLSDPPSAGFLRDIASDGDGVSLYRVQIVVWTLVAGIIFIASVYDTLLMPKLPDTLIGLMGLSSGAYIGFKVPSKA